MANDSLNLLDRHRTELVKAAIKPEVLERVGVLSIEQPDQLPDGLPSYWANYLPAKLYPWRMNGHVEWQLAPDDRTTHKYLFRDGAEIPLNQIRDNGEASVLFTEGAKQQLTAASYAPSGFAVYGVNGCWGWSETNLSFTAGRMVIVVFDGDLTTNRDVWDAAQALKEQLELVGASRVLFARLPGPGSQGLDDFLAKVDEPQRDAVLARLLERSTSDLGRAPAKKKVSSSPWFGEGGLKAVEVAHEVWRRYPAALTAEQKLALYRNGAYRIDATVLMGAVVSLLGDDHRPSYLTTVEQVLIGTLSEKGIILPDRMDKPWMNVRNGMVDLVTGERHDHDPSLLSSIQFPVVWDPNAVCPTYEAWAEEIIGDQLDALEEAVAVMLDPSVTPSQAVVLFGPARSGKSTYLRLLKAIAGSENTTGITLHQLAEDRFAAANVYGKVLNSSADLSARHVEDLSTFKMLTGEDLIHGNRKYGNQFSFTNRALFAFSANELPTVGESSRAYVERIKPFKFDHSYAGHIDMTIEPRMEKELPGILNRLVRAYRRRLERGHDLTIDASVKSEFEAASDRVQQWLNEEMQIVVDVDGVAVSPGSLQAVANCSTPKELARLFNVWASENHMATLGKTRVIARLTSKDAVVEVRQKPAKVRALNIVQRRESVASVAEVADFTSPTTRTIRRGSQLQKYKNDKMDTESHSARSRVVNSATSATSATNEENGHDYEAQPPTAPENDPVREAGSAGGTTPEDEALHVSRRADGPDRVGERSAVLSVPDARDGGSERSGRGEQVSQDTEDVTDGSHAEMHGSGEAAVADTVTAQSRPDPSVTSPEEEPWSTPTSMMPKRSMPDTGSTSTSSDWVDERDQMKEEDVPVTVAFDLETTGIDRLWTDETGSHVRLAGFAVNSRGVKLTRSIDPLRDVLHRADRLVGHNILGYDLLCLTRHHAFPRPYALASQHRLHDTKLTEALLDPPPARMKSGEAERHYSLDNVGTRYEIGHKAGDLKAMAKIYAKNEKDNNPAYDGLGFDVIPLDNPDFLNYLRQDVALTRAIAQRQGQLSDYALREHKVAALAAEISLNGFRVDTTLLDQRIRAGRQRRKELLAELRTHHGLPTMRKDGKTASKAPQMTQEGKRAIVSAFEAAGIAEGQFPVKDLQEGNLTPDLSKETMTLLRTKFSDNENVVALADLVQELNGVRPIYETIDQHLVGDRVHPSIDLRQASGRWSITKPGLTVVGKRGDRVKERDVFVAEEGEVIIAVDLSQVDARAVAVHSQDPVYMALFEPGKDSHVEVAMRVWGDPGRRQDAKVIGHGWNYGMGVKKIAAVTGLGLDAAQQFDQAMREQFPRLVEWQGEVREEGAAGRLLDNGFGRLLKVDPERAWTQAPALMGQGAARDLMMEGFLRLDPALHLYLRLQVHDELVLSVPKHSAEEIADEVKRAMTFSWCPPHGETPIQIVAEASIGGSTWASAYGK